MRYNPPQKRKERRGGAEKNLLTQRNLAFSAALRWKNLAENVLSFIPKNIFGGAYQNDNLIEDIKAALLNGG